MISDNQTTSRYQKILDWIVTCLLAAPSWLLTARLLYGMSRPMIGQFDDDKTDLVTLGLFIPYAGVLLLLSSAFMLTRKLGWAKYLVINFPLFILVSLKIMHENWSWFGIRTQELNAVHVFGGLFSRIE
jgi:hypothetical protein